MSPFRPLRRLRAIPWLERNASVPASARPVPSGPVMPLPRSGWTFRPVRQSRKKASDGRDFLPVHASEDVSFDDKPRGEIEAAAPASGPKENRSTTVIRWGCRTLHTSRRRTPAGMDYVPVYEGDDQGGAGTIKIAPGKRLQRTGAPLQKPLPIIIVRTVRAPGTSAARRTSRLRCRRSDRRLRRQGRERHDRRLFRVPQGSASAPGPLAGDRRSCRPAHDQSRLCEANRRLENLNVPRGSDRRDNPDTSGATWRSSGRRHVTAWC